MKTSSLTLLLILLVATCDDPTKPDVLEFDSAVVGNWGIINYSIAGVSQIEGYDIFTAADGLPLQGWEFMPAGDLQITVITLTAPDGTGEVIDGSWSTLGPQLTLNVSGHIDDEQFGYVIVSPSEDTYNVELMTLIGANEKTITFAR